MIFIILCSVIVGFLCGATSIGGILLIPAIQHCLDMDIHLAAGTSLCSFFFAAMFGTWLHWRSGNLLRSFVVPMCSGGIIFGCLGAFSNVAIESSSLTAILAWIIILAGAFSLRPIRSYAKEPVKKNGIVLFAISAFVGFMAGLTGVGGPVISVPIMIALGFPPLLSVASALPLQLVACFSGSIGNFILGKIDWPLAMMTVLLQIVGFYAGQRAARHIDTEGLKKCVAFLCIGTGIIMLVR